MDRLSLVSPLHNSLTKTEFAKVPNFVKGNRGEASTPKDSKWNISPLQWHSLLEVEDSLHLKKKKNISSKRRGFSPRSPYRGGCQKRGTVFWGAENPTGSWIDRNQPSNVHLHQRFCWKIQRKTPSILKKNWRLFKVIQLGYLSRNNLL